MATYRHDHKDPNLSGSQKALEYNIAGEPALRVIGNANGYGIQVADGDVPGVSHVEKFGMNLAVGLAKETVWDGSNIYTYKLVADPVTVTSTSGNDIPGGTGAHNVLVEGLDENWAVASELINVGDTGTVSFIRVFRAAVVIAGSVGVNVGTISITCTGASPILLAVIGIDGTGGNAAGRGQTFMAQYTVPAGQTAYISQWTVGSGKPSADVVAEMITRDPLAVGDGSWNSRDVIIVSATTFAKNYVVPQRVPEKNDIEVRAYSTVTGSKVSSTFSILLVDNVIV